LLKVSFRRSRGGDALAESRTSSPDDAAAGERVDLLATKLNLPRTRPDHLGRSRLIQRLNEGMAREVILVCTPAGFGKTTLLAGWAAGARLPVAWLSLDPEDNEPTRLWRYVVAALDRARGGLAEDVLPLLTPRILSSQGMVTALVNQLQATPEEVALVLDDYHLLQSRPIHDGMAFLLGHLPPQLHVVIASWGCSWPPCRCANGRIRMRSWTRSPGPIGTSWTISARRSSTVSRTGCGGSCWRPRSWSGSAVRSVTRSPAGPTARICSRSWSAPSRS